VSLVLLALTLTPVQPVGPGTPGRRASGSAAVTSNDANGDEIVQDPQAPPAETPTPPAPLVPPPARSRIWRAMLETRAGALTSWADAVGPKDVVEWRTWALLDAGEKTSDRFTWEIGARFDLLARAQRGSSTLFRREATTFEARAWEAYVDVGLLDDLRVKVGNQIVSWGRLDLTSAADMLGVYDLRQGPTSDLDSMRIPTPSVVASFYPVEALSFDVGYTPFFTPDRFDVLGTNYALVGPNVPSAGSAQLAALRRQLTPSTYAEFSDELARLTQPDARPDNGEVAARSTLHTRRLDVALSAGWLRSKLPAIQTTAAFAQLLSAPPTAGTLSGVYDSLQNGEPLIVTRYDRYLETAADAEATVGPLTFAAEMGYTPKRPLYVYDSSNPFPASASSGLSQVGAKVTYAGSLDTFVTGEVSLIQATDGPPAGARYLGFAGDNRLVAGLIAARKILGRHSLDATAVATSTGPSLIAIGRYGYAIAEGMVAGIGAVAIAGPSPYDGSLGSMARGLDQVFLFASWRP
jgi:hypothetical protein